MSEKDSRDELHELMLENQRLLTENNKYVRKLYRMTVWAFWMRMLWVAILIGLPFVVYYFVIEPYFTSLGSSFETFQAGLQEVPGWKQFYEALQGHSNGGE